MAHTNIRVYGTTWCPDCRRSKKFLGEQRIHYEWIDVEQDKDGLRFIEEVNNGKHIIPTMVFEDGSILVEPSNAELAAKLGLLTEASRTFYDLIVVGSGPAGLTAALYAAREGIETLVVERSGLGGQAGVTERLDNFPGFPEGVGGSEFADRLVAQARRFGVEILSATEVADLESEGEYRTVRTERGDVYRASAVLLALGSTYRRLNVPGEDDFIGAGVHYCATCDGPFYRDQEVLVVGGGNSATEEGLFLTQFASKVTILTNTPQLTASQIIQEKVLAHPRIDVVYHSTVEAFKGEGRLGTVVVKNLQTGEQRELHPGGVFVFIGLTPNTGFLRGTIHLDHNGFVVTNPTLETSVGGVFAAGDARQGSTKQAASAAGEGATAALMIRQYLREQRGT